MALAIQAPLRPRFLPPQLAQFLKLRALELIGAGLILAALIALTALLTYDRFDPSASMASGQSTANWLGGKGAAGADGALRLVGLAAGVLPFVALSWGWRFCLHLPPAVLWLRVALTPLAAILVAAAAAALPVFEFWPLSEGLGGALGQSALGNIRQISADFAPGAENDMAGLIAAILAIALTAWCAAPPLGPIWRTLRWCGRATAWSYGMGSIAARRVTARAQTVIGDLDERPRGFRRNRGDDIAADDAWDDDADTAEVYDAVEDQTPAPEIEPSQPRKQRKGLSERIGGALAGRKTAAEKKSAKTPEKAKQRKAPKPPARPKARRAKSGRQPDLPLEDGFQLPPLDLLQEPEVEAAQESQALLDDKARMLEGVLDDFGVKGEIKRHRQGPVVTLFELEPAPGVKASRVVGLADDLARNMSAVSVRVATVPGKNVIGVELPNGVRETVFLRELLSSREYKSGGALPIALGKDIGGGSVIVDLARMPHLLIAGTTGSGKSVAVNAMILSLLYAMTPEQCRFIMIDPKMLELSVYDGVPHLLAPVVTEPKKAVVALKWVVREMENRYRAMSTLGVRNIAGYNVKIEEARAKGEALTRRVQTGFDPDTGRPIYEEQPLDMRPLPFIVVVVDEMADLMLVAGKDIEATIQRLAQMARAAGIHLIMATQRPSVDVITGTIKANFPTRISFQVTSKIDSRTILSEGGAEQLLGQGDGLYMAGGGRIKRIHGPFVDDMEVGDIVNFLKGQAPPDYVESVTEDETAADGIPGFEPVGGDSDGGEGALYDQAVAIVARDGKASTSYLQRRLKIGYNRAASLIEEMEQQGVVSAANHVGKREILIGDHSDD